MTTDPISTCLSAINALDAATFASPFTPHATLTDEGRTHTRSTEVKKWAQDALADHRASVVELERIELDVKRGNMEEGGERKVDAGARKNVVVHVTMDRAFRESHGIVNPFELWMSFEFAGDGTRVQNLLIEQKRPEECEV